MDGVCFKKHRDRIIDILTNGGLGNSIIFMPSANEQKEIFTESDLSFIQEGIFFWLTGWDHPSSSIIIDVKNNYSVLTTTSFDAEYETWHGRAPTNAEIIAQTGVDSVRQGANPDEIMSEMMKKFRAFEHRFLAFPKSPVLPIDDIGTLICAVSIGRRAKFDHEIAVLRRASVASSMALIEVMKKCVPGIRENILAAIFLFNGTLLGGRGLSFPVTAASGCRGAYLHYRDNCEIANDGEMVLFDCGLYVEHYAGDVTRTFPVNGKFTLIQKKVYSALFRAQTALIESVRPGITLYDLETNMNVQIFEILRLVGVVDNFAEFDVEVAQLFCPHSISHHIGVSVHDWSFYNGKCLLEVEPMEAFRLVPNMVISIEPGIYFNEILMRRHADDPKFANSVNFEVAFELAKTVCAVRIEDDVLVTADGCEVLSNCPKSVEDIEALMMK